MEIIKLVSFDTEAGTDGLKTVRMFFYSSSGGIVDFFCDSEIRGSFIGENPRKRVDFSPSEDSALRIIPRIMLQVFVKSGSVWNWLKEQVGNLEKSGAFQCCILDAEKVIVFRSKKWLEILAANLPSDWE